ncbi:MAG: FAD-binding oxidoreductase [Acidobacteriia bacterium]|nr:FAD-binding oxidoreductase [Terriglobia bacterium]
MPLKERPYWMDTTSIPAGDPSVPLPEAVDVAVIGGGFTGLSAALALARRGAKVAVLEAETFGWGASSRNGGMVLTGLKKGPETLIARYGLDVARRLYAASLASIDCVEQLVTEEGIACDFSRSGHLEVAVKLKHFEGFERSAELIAREFNHKLRVVPKKELHEEIGSEIYHGGLVDETSAGVNPARYVAGLRQAAARAGARLCDRTRVESIERQTANGAAPYRVSTSRGTLGARAVFAATSGYTGNATPALERRIVPIGSYIIVTQPLAEDLARTASPRGRMIYDSKNFLYYYRLTPDRRMLFGGRAAFFPETANTVRKSAEILRQGMLGVYPFLRDTEIEYVWGGTLDFAFDIMPHAGQLDGLFYALGYAGHGVAMATYLGAKMAGVICGDAHENPFDGLPFPTAPLGLYNGRPWFLPLGAAWYRFLDWVT